MKQNKQMPYFHLKTRNKKNKKELEKKALKIVKQIVDKNSIN